MEQRLHFDPRNERTDSEESVSVIVRNEKAALRIGWIYVIVLS